MTIRRRVLVQIPDLMSERILELANQARACVSRGHKLYPGDYSEQNRFNTIQYEIERITATSVMEGAKIIECEYDLEDSTLGTNVFHKSINIEPSPIIELSNLIDKGYVVVCLSSPFYAGKGRENGIIGIGPPKPVKRWQSNEKSPRESVKKRFISYLNEAVSEGTKDPQIKPSGVSNSILTEGLRKYSAMRDGRDPVDAKIVYRDGSQGSTFPLLSIKYEENIKKPSKEYNFSLISIRHVEMDHILDAAWLRNIVISQSRVSGFTDDIVYKTSKEQIEYLTRKEPVLINMFQTGLDTAILGFYRAVAETLIKYPQTLTVIPWYYNHKNGGFSKGTPWQA